jgi:hypothetical protein
MTRTEDAPSAEAREPDAATLAYWERMQQLRSELDAVRPAN